MINKHPQSRILIIGAGSSTKELISYRNKLKNFWDVVIGVGGTFQVLDDVLDYHLVTEKVFREQLILNKFDFSPTLPRLVNCKAIDKYNPKYNLIPITRVQRPNNFNIREFIPAPYCDKGLLIGKVGEAGLALGSVMLSAIHLAAILGASSIYTIGLDLYFKEADKDHFYKDQNYYRSGINKHPAAAKPVKVIWQGREIETTDYMRDSAPVIDDFIYGDFRGIAFIDFSKGLLESPIRLDFQEFAEKVDISKPVPRRGG